MALAVKPNHASRGKFGPDQASRQKWDPSRFTENRFPSSIKVPVGIRFTAETHECLKRKSSSWIDL